MLIDSEVVGKIKWTLTDSITKEYKDKSMKNKARVNIISTIDNIPTDTLNALNNISQNVYCAFRWLHI